MQVDRMTHDGAVGEGGGADCKNVAAPAAAGPGRSQREVSQDSLSHTQAHEHTRTNIHKFVLSHSLTLTFTHRVVSASILQGLWEENCGKNGYF